MNQVFLSGFNLNELLEKIGQLIDTKLSLVSAQDSNKNQSEKYISRQEVARLLKLSLPTLHDYTKIGWLQSYKLGKRVLYKREEVLATVDKVATFKHRKGGFNHGA